MSKLDSNKNNYNFGTVILEENSEMRTSSRSNSNYNGNIG